MISDSLTHWLNDNYSAIELMAAKITRGSPEAPDLLHYSLLHFLEHGRAEELVAGGQAMKFLSGIMWRSFHSGTSAYHTEYRQKGRVHTHEPQPEEADDPYDYERDQVVTEIKGIIRSMRKSGEIELWFHATLFEMWLENPNYSKLAKKIGIPRTSISHAVRLTKKHIITKLKEKGITWNG